MRRTVAPCVAEEANKDGVRNEDGRTEQRCYKGGVELATLTEKELKSSAWSALGHFEMKGDYNVHGSGPQGFGQTEATVTGGPSPAGVAKTCQQSVPTAEKVHALQGLSGRVMGQCGTKIFQFFLEVVSLRSQTTGRRIGKTVFPLPTSRTLLLGAFPDLAEEVLDWLMCVVVCLNSFWGCEVFNDLPPNEIQLKCLNGLLRDIQRFCEVHAVVPDVGWTEFFMVKSIDYKGDEVRVARRFKWENIGPALPGDVGSVPLVDVCTLGCQHYVKHFESYLKPKPDWAKMTWPRVMVDDCDWDKVCQGLVDSGVCIYIRESEVFDTGSGPLLNGLFGVTKDEFTDSGVEIFRLIMNLIPLNGMCQPIAGDVDTLPAWSSMNPYFLQPHENLLVSSEDVKCFFYTMALPEAWSKFLAFNKPVPAHVVPDEYSGETVYIAARVLPMGFLNSVSLAQHVHRNLVAWSRGDDHRCNAPEAELRKDKSFSHHHSNWRIYLDNYDLLEKVVATQMVETQSTCPAGVLALREGYEQWQVPRNLKKSVTRSAKCEVQGCLEWPTLGRPSWPSTLG